MWLESLYFLLRGSLLLLRRCGTPLNALTMERQEAGVAFGARAEFPAWFQLPPESHSAEWEPLACHSRLPTPIPRARLLLVTAP